MVAVLGAGESGVGAAVLAQQMGEKVFVSDLNPIAPSYKSLLTAHDIPFEEGGHTLSALQKADLIICSPGIPDTAPILQSLHNIPVIDELSFAAQYTQTPLIVITGSNGKTTTAALTHHLLQQHGLSTALVGNIGKSFARVLAMTPAVDYYVVEASSFQLERAQGLHPYMLAYTSFSPDHIDRHKSFQAYQAAKLTPLKYLQATDHLVFNADDTCLSKILKHHPVIAQQHPISMHACFPKGSYIKDQHWICTATTPYSTIDGNTFKLPGQHNTLNGLTAVTLAALANVPATTIEQGLKSFQGIPHRLEYVGTFSQRHYYNDSKATNVAATLAALQSFSRPIVWIAGGLDKGNDYKELLPIVSKKVRSIVLLGKNNEKIAKAFESVVPIAYIGDSLKQAVFYAHQAAHPHDAILLAPACASFDLFENFAHRGDCFKATVQQQYTH